MSSSLFDSSSDMVYHASINSQCLRDFNNAITALYTLASGAYTCDTRNTATYVEDVVKRFGLDIADVANKLEMTRSLIFGDAMNWDHVAQTLKCMCEKEGAI